MGKIFISSATAQEGRSMNLKFWTWGKKKQTVIVTPEPPKKKGDYFRDLASRFMPSKMRKLKHRQRGERKGLSRREWENLEGKKWKSV